MRPLIVLAGSVTLNGSPAAGVALDLRFYNGSSWSTSQTVVTLADGTYTFSNVPALTTGQAYYVRYLNSTDPSRVYIWQSEVNQTYNATNPVAFDAFDIANIALAKPDPGASVKLPYAFTWTPRPATLTDSYEYDLFDFTDSDPWYNTDPLGYVGSYTLSKRPTSFVNGTNYGWEVVVHSPDGGQGVSYYYYYVKFNSSPGGLAALPAASSGPRRLPSTWAAPGIPADQ